jgi:hypothetical protein
MHGIDHVKLKVANTKRLWIVTARFVGFWCPGVTTPSFTSVAVGGATISHARQDQKKKRDSHPFVGVKSQHNIHCQPPELTM